MKEIMKKLTVLLLVIVLAVSLLSVSAFAQEIEISEDIEQQEEIEISEAEEELQEEPPEYLLEESEKPDNAQGVQLEESGDHWTLDEDGTLYVEAFYENGSIPNYDAVSQSEWFKYRSQIKKIVFAEDVMSIGNYSFSMLENLTEIQFPNSLTRIGRYAFNKCTGLTRLDFPEKLETIEQYAFYECKSLAEVNLPESLITIGMSAFYSCNLKEVKIPRSLQDYKNAFPSNTLRIIPYSECELRSGNFTINTDGLYMCVGGAGHSFDQGVITEAGGPNTKGTVVFTCADCGAVCEYQFFEDQNAASIEYYSSDNCNYPIVPKKIGKAKVVAIDNAFRSKSLIGVELPDTLQYLRKGSFQYCRKLREVVFSKNLKSIAADTFLYCTALKEVVLPNGLESIGNSAFSHCSSLKTVSIPDSVTEIKYGAFYQCENLENVRLSAGLKTLGGSIFYRCDSLKSITIPDGITNITYTFSKCINLETVVLPSTLRQIGGLTFTGCSALKEVIIPEGTLYIKDSTFSGCSSLEKITLPSTLKKIREYAFSGCSSLKEISLPNKLTMIGASAFANCDSLTEAVIPDSVTELGNSAFYNCSALKKITVPPSVTTVGKNAFGLYYSAVTDKYEPVQGFVVYCHKDSAAETFAKENGITYKSSAHKWDEGVITQHPTSQKDGVRTYTCKICGKQKTGKVKYVPVTKVALNKNNLELTVGKSATLKATVSPSSVEDKAVSWKSSDPSVAKVDKNGKVTALKYGKATITATSATDKNRKASCKVQTRFTDATKQNVDAEMFDAIYWVADNKITGNTESFGTKHSMTRGQFVRFLYRYAGMEGKYKPEVKKSPFKDVDKSYTHYKAILWAVEQGLIEGYADGSFKPEKTLTRNNVATILWKFAGAPKVSNIKKPFADVAKSAAIAWGKSKKIFTGSKFKPKDNCLRGDFALFLYRYHNNVKN